MKDKIRELRESADKDIEAGRGFIDQITDESTEADALELNRKADLALESARQKEARAKTMEGLLEMEEQKDREAEERERNERELRRPGGKPPEGRETEKPKYKDVFLKILRSGSASLNDAERTVFAENRSSDPDVERRALAAGSDTAGGFTVPTEFSGEIEKQLEDWGPMYAEGATRQFRTSHGRRVDWPTLNYTAERGEAHTEGGAVTNDGSGDPVFGNKELDGYVRNTPIVKVSLELLADSAFNIESLLAELFGESLGRTANDALTTGDGLGNPNGIITGASVGHLSQSQTAIVADELLDLEHSVNQAYRRSPMCKWQFNDETLKALRKLKDGDGNYLWQRGNIVEGAPPSLLSKPYMINDSMDDIGAGLKPILFGDHSRYVVRKIGDFQVVVFREKFMDTLSIGMMAFMRFDGEILNNTALKTFQMAA